MALTLFLISIITFVITNILPGDVAMMIMGTQSNPEALANLRDKLGLNDPLLAQYGNWILGIVQGDLGTSLLFKMPIGPLLLQKITSSALIVALSMSIALLLAIPLGVWAAVYKNRWQDNFSSSVSIIGVSLPDFFWGIMLILIFARALPTGHTNSLIFRVINIAGPGYGICFTSTTTCINTKCMTITAS